MKFSVTLIWRILLVIGGPTLIVLMVLAENFFKPFNDAFKAISELPGLFFIIVSTTVFFGILHLYFTPKNKISNEHLLFKRLGPVLSAPITGATNGIFIHSGIQIIHIFCYNFQNVNKYEWLDKTTITITVLTLMTYAVYSMYLMVIEIFKLNKDESQGEVE